MERAFHPEILESPGVPEQSVDRAYRDLTRLHRLIGDTHAVIRAIRRDPLPVRRVLDIGCARGGVSLQVQRALRVEVIGVDVALPPEATRPALPMIRADAVRDALPKADVAYCMHVAHHFSDDELIAMIRNVGRSCRRLVLIDLIRHRVPLILFRLFLAPFVCRITASDGQLSVRKAYTTGEFRDLVARAVAGSDATFRHSVTPFWIRQLVDISWRV